MKLNLQMLDPSSTLNKLHLLSEVEVYPGSTATIMFQLVDLNQQLSDICDLYSRYVPASGATVSVVISNLDSANVVTKTATNPFADDRSIWSFDLTATETTQLSGITLQVTVTEGASVKKFISSGVLVVHPSSPFTC